MGANFDYVRVKEQVSKEEAVRLVEKHIQECLYDYGHAGYTGTMAECTGVTLLQQPSFQTYSSAEEWLEENTQKWGPALLVKVEDKGWVAGGCCSD
jgi:hypothetical protein